jgi:valyl-tRNA synthetase
VLTGEDDVLKAETRAMVGWVIDQSILVLHPFMPFLTEALWEATAGAMGRETMAALAPWPALDGLVDPSADAEIGWLVDLVTEIRSIRTEIGIPGGAQVPLVLINPSADVSARVQRLGETLKRLARLSSIEVAAAAPNGAVQVLTRGTTAALALAGIIDLDVERARLAKELDKIDGEIAKIDQKLNNPAFIANAKEEVVDEQRDRREDAIARRDKIAEARKRLG